MKTQTLEIPLHGAPILKADGVLRPLASSLLPVSSGWLLDPLEERPRFRGEGVVKDDW